MNTTKHSVVTVYIFCVCGGGGGGGLACLNDLHMCMYLYKQTYTNPHAQEMHTAYHKGVKDIGT